jgi:hypothetical protein
MSVAEVVVARQLIAQLPDGGGGYVLGDSWFDANGLYDRCHAKGPKGRQLLARHASEEAPRGWDTGDTARTDCTRSNY